MPGGQTPETLASGPGPDAEAHGVWAIHQGLWRLVLEVRVGLFLAGKTDFEEAFTTSFDPRAQHINRGAGLAPGTHKESPSHVPATPSPLVYPPSSFCSAWRSPTEIVLQHQPSPRRRAAGTHLLLRPSC